MFFVWPFVMLDVESRYLKLAFNNITKAIKDVSGREYWPVLFNSTPYKLRTYIDQTLAGPKSWFTRIRDENKAEMLMPL